MLSDSKRYSMPWASLLLSPLASIPAMAVSGLGSSDAGLISDLGVGILFGVTVGVPVSFAGIIIVGLPIYFLLRKFEALKLWIACSIGALVPFLILFNDAPLRMTLGGCSAGGAVAALAYAFRPRE